MKQLRENAGLTLIEVLVATMVLAVGILSIITVYFAAGHFGRQAIRQSEAARLSRDVANYMERQTTTWMDLVAMKSPPANRIHSEDLAPYPFRSSANLVWRCRVRRYPTWKDESGLYVLDVAIHADDNGDRTFDLEPDDTPVATFVTLVRTKP